MRIKRGPKNKIKGIQRGLRSNHRIAHQRETVSESIKFCLDIFPIRKKKKKEDFEFLLCHPKLGNSSKYEMVKHGNKHIGPRCNIGHAGIASLREFFFSSLEFLMPLIAFI